MDIVIAFSKICMMVSCTCLIGIALGYPAARWIGGKVATFLTFLPQEQFAKAPPALGIPRAKAMGGDLAGAVEAYEALLISHPHEREIYYRLLELVMGPLQSDAYGEEVLQRGLANLSCPSDRAMLIALAQEIRDGRYRPLPFLESRAAEVKQIVYDPNAPRLVKVKQGAS